MDNGEERWKARLVVRGFEEKKIEGRTEAPMCSSEGLKICLSVIKREGWKVRSIDVKTAYLQGENIERTIVVKPPRELKTEKLWMLRKAVYGLKDAPRVWYETVVRVVTEMGGRRSRMDATFFVWRKRGRIIGIMVKHVDDFCF